MALSSTRVRAALLLLFCVMAGAMAGVIGDRLLLLHGHRLLPPHGLGFVSKRIATRLDRELKLSDAQRAQVEKILHDHETRISAVWNDVQPRVHAEIEKADQEIDAILDAQQKTRFREMRERWQRQAHRFLH